MRILHVTRDFPPRINGGISNAVGGIVQATRALGVEIAVLSFDAWRPKAPATAAPLDPTQDVFRLRGAADLEAAHEFARHFGPDLLHLHDGMVADAIEIDAERVFSVHVNQAVQRRLRNLDAPTKSELAQHRAIERAKAIVTPSQAARDELRAEHPGAAAHVIPLGVTMPPEPANGTDLLYVGRLADIKGTRELFETMRKIDATLVVAGGLPDNQRAERRWRERAPDNVEFTGWLDEAALAARYQRARLLIAPSWHETFGLAVAEAMSHGVPAIVTDAGALRERVRHEVSGLLVPPRDPVTLAQAIKRLRADDELHATLSRGAREAARAWTWERCASALVAVYEQV